MQGSGLLTWNVTAAAAPSVSSAYDVPLTNPFNMGFGLNIQGGADVTLQFSFDKNDWFDHPYASNQTADVAGNFAFPIRSIRLRFNEPGVCIMSALIPGIISEAITENAQVI